MLSRILCLVALLPALLSAQAAVESILTSAKSATTTAPAADAAGKVIGTSLDKIGQVFHDAVGTKPAPAQVRSAPRAGAKSTAARRSTARGRGTAVPEPVPSVTYEDPAAIREGMEYEEVKRRFGPPAMQFTSGPGEELFSYSRTDQIVDVQIRNGKVTSVQRTGDSDPVPAQKLP